MSAVEGLGSQLTGVPISTAINLNLGSMGEPQRAKNPLILHGTHWVCMHYSGAQVHSFAWILREVTNPHILNILALEAFLPSNVVWFEK